MDISPGTKPVLLPVCLMTALALTNVWPDYYYGYAVLGQTDTASYRAIALAAPRLPGETIFYHHAQRFWLPWLLGILANVSGAHQEFIFRGAVLGLWTGIIAVFARILHAVRLSLSWQAVLLAGLVFNPYCGRYYLAVPFMAPDLLFVLGFSLTILGLVRKNAGIAAIGLVVAALGRQTALPMMVALWGWIAWSVRRREADYTAVMKIAAASLVAIGVYLLGGLFARATGAASTNAGYLTGLVVWLFSDSPHKSAQLVEFFLRIFASEAFVLLLLGVLLFAVKGKVPGDFWFPGAVVMSIWLQPVLAGPAINANNQMRLCALGLVGLLTMAALLVREVRADLSRWVAGSVVCSAFIGSLHHRWSSPGESLVQTPGRFAAVTLLAAVVAGLVLIFGLRRREV